MKSSKAATPLEPLQRQAKTWAEQYTYLTRKLMD